MMKYYPPHVHTDKGSIGDSCLKTEEYIKKAKQLSLDALFITDHGSLSNMYSFVTECKNNKIQPIIGCEVYTVENRLEKQDRKTNHLVLIAKNQIGLNNLIQISSDANLNGFYYKGRTDIDYIKRYSKGIIALSACIAGKIPEMILDNKSDEEIEYIINKYKDIFEDFYLEIQPGNFKEQEIVNKKLITLAKTTNTALICSNDIHYLNKDDWYSHDKHVKLSRKVKDIDGPLIYPDKCYYLMSTQEIFNSLLKIGVDRDIVIESINNTQILRNSIEEYNIDMDIKFPIINTNNIEYKKIIEYYARKKLNNIKNRISNLYLYEDRLNYELETIDELGYSSYFLVVRDYLKMCKKNDIETGPGRGSCCGSLVAYLLDITKIDPIKYDLMFERFLSVYRKGSVPDIDIDIASKKRSNVMGYILNKYGKEYCVLVSTFGIRKAKGAIRDVGRILNMDQELIDTIAKLIPTVYYDNGQKETDLDLETSIKVTKPLQEYQKKYPKLFDLAKKLEGLPRHKSIHASGIVISPISLSSKLPLIKSKDEILSATSVDLKSAEAAGFIKYDFLGLSTLDIINNLKKTTGYIFNAEFDGYDDEKVWDIIGSKYTDGLFQISSTTYKKRMISLKPKSIIELAHCLALLRSPCIMAKQDIKYINILQGKEEVDEIHPIYNSATKDTYGILLFQEQLMLIMQNCGFSKEDSFRIMKAAAKKKVDKLETYYIEYKKLVKDKMNIETANKIWEIVLKAGLYLFNKSHAVAYAVLCYITAYYKVYYPTQFMAAVLTDAYENKKNITSLIRDCKRLKIKFVYPNINEADWDFKVIDTNIIMIGFCAIKTLGKKASIDIIQNRFYSSLSEIIDNTTTQIVNKKILTALIFSGALNEINNNRSELYKDYIVNIRKEDLKEISMQGIKKFDYTISDSAINKLIYQANLFYKIKK